MNLLRSLANWLVIFIVCTVAPMAFAQQPSDFSIAQYYLYSNNMQDQWGEYTDGFLDLKSCGDVRLEASADLSKIWIKTYVGREMPGLGIELNRSVSGIYEMPLGQTIYTHPRYGDVVLATYDTNLRIYDTEGSVPFELQSGSLSCLYDKWIYGYAPAADRFFSDLTSMKLAIYRPNAVVEYSSLDDNGNVAERVNKPLLFETLKDKSGFCISGILPAGDGFVAHFESMRLATGETVYVCEKAPIAPSGYDSEGERTGYYYLQASKSIGSAPIDRVIGRYDSDNRQFTWCADCYLLGITDYDFWQAATASGRSMGLMSRATVKIDYELGILESYATDPIPEYYTLQGIKVSDPAPGHIYIVKTGNDIVKLRY